MAANTTELWRSQHMKPLRVRLIRLYSTPELDIPELYSVAINDDVIMTATRYTLNLAAANVIEDFDPEDVRAIAQNTATALGVELEEETIFPQDMAAYCQEKGVEFPTSLVEVATYANQFNADSVQVWTPSNQPLSQPQPLRSVPLNGAIPPVESAKLLAADPEVVYVDYLSADTIYSLRPDLLPDQMRWLIEQLRNRGDGIIKDFQYRIGNVLFDTSNPLALEKGSNVVWVGTTQSTREKERQLANNPDVVVALAVYRSNLAEELIRVGYAASDRNIDKVIDRLVKPALPELSDKLNQLLLELLEGVNNG